MLFGTRGTLGPGTELSQEAVYRTRLYITHSALEGLTKEATIVLHPVLIMTDVSEKQSKYADAADQENKSRIKSKRCGQSV